MNILILTWLVPLLLAIVSMAASLMEKDVKRAISWLPVVAILPALWAAMQTIDPVHLPWFLFGSEFGLDSLERLFLLACALVWLAASLYIALSQSITDHQHRFIALLLLAMTGNLMLIIARDVASFYLGFTMMSLSTYGLVIQQGNHKARFAGKVYMILALAGELALFAAVLMFVQRNGMMLPAMTGLLPFNNSAISPSLLEQGLYIIGFGIKGGLLGLHIWLPLAHPAAPAGASAILSGAMLKAALVGFIRFMPMGT